MARDGQPGKDKKVAPSDEMAGPVKDGRGLLQVGSVYQGRIASLAKGGRYNVVVDTPRGNVADCFFLGGICSGLLGFKFSTILPVGTRVAIAYGRPSFIFAVGNADPPDAKNGGNRSALWGDAVNPSTSSGTEGDVSVAEDLVPGEFEIGNMFGVTMQFLTTLMAMKAGDRAKVEVHLLNDMVRLVSGQFRHVSGLGEELIFDHGRPSLERSWSTYRHEVLNKLKDREKLFETKGDEVDKQQIDRINSLGRSRFLEYVGFMGDFIHSFITDPPAALVDLATATSMDRAGKSWQHRGLDGTIITQSIAEIRSEVVTRIPVAVRKKNHEDPEITKARRYAELEKSYLKLWNYGKREDKNAYRTAYELREYARYLTRYQAFARALQLSDEFRVPTEAGSPVPSRTNLEEDRGIANADVEYEEVYSVISQLRDGSIIIHDGYGSSVTLSNGNVQISAARHLDLEAAGDIRLAAGGSFYVKAKRNIEMSASVGGMILHSFSVMKALCERGSVWLKTGAKASETDPKEDGAPAPEILPHGIYLEATDSGIGIRANKELALASDATPTDKEDRNELTGITLSAKANIHVQSGNFLVLASLRDIVMSASKALVTHAARWYGKHSEISWGKIFMRPNAGKLSTVTLDAKRLRVTESIRSKKQGPITDPDASTGGVASHFNHVQILEKPEELVFEEGEDEKTLASLDYAAVEALVDVSTWKSTQDGPRWQFFANNEYHWDSREEQKGALVQTLTQQHIVRDSPDYWGDGSTPYDTWNWKSDKIVSLPRTGDNKQGFGGTAKQYQAPTGQNLHVASSTPAASFGSPTRTWTATDVTSFKILKR